jgi:heat shock protein HtpX
MKYIGIMAQRRRNNLRSALLLALFPCLVVGLIYLACYLITFSGAAFYDNELVTEDNHIDFSEKNKNLEENARELFLFCLPYTLAAVGLWFVIAYFSHIHIIRRATHSQQLERRENKKVYNLVENLCMSQGMSMPKINVINDDSLNAFASGINKNTYTVTLTTGIIKHLNDEELEAVIAHELTHIRNRDVRLMIIAIVFVGIFTVLAQLSMRTLHSQARFGNRRNGKNGGSIAIIALIMILVAAIGYLFSSLMRFAISRKREYMADAGAAEITKRPWALASALRKISKDPLIEAIERKDIAQLFIESPSMSWKNGNIFGLFSTHPPIEKRIAILDNF